MASLAIVKKSLISENSRYVPESCPVLVGRQSENTENVRIWLPNGRPTIAISEAQIHHVLRIIADENVIAQVGK